VICDFYSENIYQLEDIEECSKQEWEFNYSEAPSESTSFEDYELGFEELMGQINSGRFEKIVFTKTKQVDLKRDPLDIFEDLCKNYLNTFNYMLSSPELGSWMGATPEKLCEIEDKKIAAVSLAGTKSSSEKWSNKEIEEQLYVTRFIEQKLKNLHCGNIMIDGPHNIQAGPVIHLKTIISGELLSKEIWRKVIDDLHPTPATCGIPALKSQDFIRKVEKHNRSIYTGFIGVFQEETKRCYVNLRCMELFDTKAVLYVGGGITAASEIDKEWQETERKAETLERFIG
jgi:isochorismate synthase